MTHMVQNWLDTSLQENKIFYEVWKKYHAFENYFWSIAGFRKMYIMYYTQGNS